MKSKKPSKQKKSSDWHDKKLSTMIRFEFITLCTELRHLTPQSAARRRRVGWIDLLAATLAPISLLHGAGRRKESMILTPDLPIAPSQKVENCTELTPCPPRTTAQNSHASSTEPKC